MDVANKITDITRQHYNDGNRECVTTSFELAGFTFTNECFAEDAEHVLAELKDLQSTLSKKGA